MVVLLRVVWDNQIYNMVFFGLMLFFVYIYVFVVFFYIDLYFSILIDIFK